VAFITVYGGMYYMSGDLETISEIIVFAIIVGVNVYFLLSWLVSFLEAYSNIIKRKHTGIFDKILRPI
jgi:hypothetical protein